MVASDDVLNWRAIVFMAADQLEVRGCCACSNRCWPFVVGAAVIWLVNVLYALDLFINALFGGEPGEFAQAKAALEQWWYEL